jgi:putative hemolysin
MPAVVREIGRLREITFRKVGEGTGRAADLDRFDDHYLHLVLWDESRSQVAGSYRLGLTDEILARLGPEGLYTRSLFDYGPPVLEKLSRGIELGRSFVRDEYQKEYAPLMLLWKGIARFIVAHPRYFVLYGTVSISNQYSSLTRSLLAAFLRVNCEYPDLMRHVRARQRPRFGWFRRREAELAAVAARDMDDVDKLVAELENGRRAPVLVRQYLKLNARLLGFNVDPNFGDSLDALMMVDLLEVQPAVLARYMGAEGYRAFYARWGRRIAIKP